MSAPLREQVRLWCEDLRDRLCGEFEAVDGAAAFGRERWSRDGELSGAKAIAPYYGTSLFARGAVLGVTIGALALGYFLGGVAARRGALVSTLSVCLSLARCSQQQRRSSFPGSCP